MEKELFHWNSFDLLIKENKSEEIETNNKENTPNEKLISNKPKKYHFDIGATFITINNSVFCFNKNNISGQSNSYLKVDKIKNINPKEKNFTVKNIYSKLNGPRYRVTNVKLT